MKAYRFIIAAMTLSLGLFSCSKEEATLPNQNADQPSAAVKSFPIGDAVSPMDATLNIKVSFKWKGQTVTVEGSITISAKDKTIKADGSITVEGQAPKKVKAVITGTPGNYAITGQMYDEEGNLLNIEDYTELLEAFADHMWTNYSNTQSSTAATINSNTQPGDEVIDNFNFFENIGVVEGDEGEVYDFSNPTPEVQEIMDQVNTIFRQMIREALEAYEESEE